MKITSSAFEDNKRIPSEYTCDGEDKMPPLSFEEIPEETKSLVLIIDDPDSPKGVWDHFIIYNIPKTGELEGVFGKNTWGKNEYGGPCPGSGEHRYFFKLFALDTILDLREGATKEELLSLMEGHVIEKAELVGRYSRK